MKFDIEKNGFNADQVTRYIEKLEASLSEQKSRIDELKEDNKELQAKLKIFEEKDKKISQALLLAVSKAQEIEDLAKSKYMAEMDRLKEFHSKWTRYFAEIKKRYPLDKTLLSGDEFLQEIDSILKTDLSENINRNERHSNREKQEISETDTMYSSEVRRLTRKEEALKEAITGTLNPSSEYGRRYEKLLNTYNRKVALTPEGFSNTVLAGEKSLTYNKAASKTELLSPINEIEGFYAKTKPISVPVSKPSQPNNTSMPSNDSGFDMVEALRPKQSLEEIIRDLGLLEGED